MISRANKPRNVSGFSLVDIPMSVSLLSTMLAIAVPAAKDTVDGLRLGMATRDIERELQTARLKAVSANRPLRVQLNCPTVGQFRIIEITGVGTTDTDGNRWYGNVFPYQGPKDTDRATPEQDEPVRTLALLSRCPAWICNSYRMERPSRSSPAHRKRSPRR